MVMMRLKTRKSYKFFYILNFIVIAACFFGIVNNNTASTFADEDAAQEISGSHFVTIHDGDQFLTIKTDALTVQEVLERANLTLDPNDRIEPQKTEIINADNYHINIYRARPVVITDGKTKKYIMSASYDAKTIAKEAGIAVYDGDEIKLSSSTDFLATGIATTYLISRNGGRTITMESPVAFSEETVSDPTLDVGQTKLIQVGEDGLKVTKYNVNFIDGEEQSRELVSEEVTKQPINRITAVGTKQTTIRPEWSQCAEWARQAGVSENDLYSALSLIYKESGCRVSATNASSGAYGIPQALPGNKMASAGSDWQTNPVTQIKWMAGYVNRYGGWAGAWAFWQAHGWY